MIAALVLSTLAACAVDVKPPKTGFALIANGKPAAKLVPVEAPKKKLRLGLLAGKYPPMDFDAFQAMDAEIEAMFLGEEK